MKTLTRRVVALSAAACALAATPVLAQNAGDMSFFVTSAGPGDGANLGGLAGADAHCQTLAAAAGSGGRTWVAYLSTQGTNAVNARDRIGSGPWHNAAGVIIAEDVATLHRDDVNIDHETALDENGEMVPYVRQDATGAAIAPENQPEPVEHDILTGTQADGTAFPAGDDRTCANWTSNGEGSAMLGHHDRRSLQPGLSPWSQAHPSQGCDQQSLVNTGGAGRLYCFAQD
jgi:hypothetical protein